MDSYPTMENLVTAALEKNIEAVIDGSESVVMKVRIHPIRPTIFFYNSWRPMFRCTVHYRKSGQKYKQEVFAKAKASRIEFDHLKRIWEVLPVGAARWSVPRPVGFESFGKNNILLTEYVPGWNMNQLMCGACLPGMLLFAHAPLRRWSRKIAEWLSDFQSHFMFIDPEMTGREIEEVRQKVKSLDLLPGRLRNEIERYITKEADGFLQVHRAPSLDFVARNLLLHGDRIVFVDFEPFGYRNIFRDGLRFCADLRTKTRYPFYSSSGFDLIERTFWDGFNFRRDEGSFIYAKVLSLSNTCIIF